MKSVFVEIKRCKLSKSLLNQASNPTENELLTFNVEGWYKDTIRNTSFILFTNNSGTIIRRLVKIDSVNKKNVADSDPNPFKVIISFRKCVDRVHIFDNEPECDKFLARMNDILKEVNEKGQFYV